MSKELVVFTNNGQTYIFHNVTNFRPTTTGFSFTYTGKATGVVREAVFNNTSTSGYALADEPDDNAGVISLVKPTPTSGEIGPYEAKSNIVSPDDEMNGVSFPRTYVRSNGVIGAAI